MKGFKNNIYIKSHNKIIRFCEQCKSLKKSQCSKYDKDCAEYASYLREIYFNDLHPHHPCKECIVGVCCTAYYCDTYYHYHRKRFVAECEIRGHVVFFSKEKLQIVAGSADFITKEYIETVEYFRTEIDFATTENYIRQIKSEADYEQILRNVYDRIKYDEFIKENDSAPEFKTDFS